MIRVCLVGPYPLDPQRVPGGVAAATLYLVQGLRLRKDIDLHVVAVTKDIHQSFTRVDDGTTVHFVREPRRRLIPNQLTSIERVKKVVRSVDPDVVHGETPIGTLAGAGCGLPAVHTIHGIIHRELKLAKSPAKRLNMAMLSWLTQKAVSRAQHVIAVSPYAGREYRPYVRGHLHEIFNAADDRFFDVPDARVSGRMLYVGHISPLKNVLGLVRAFDLVRRERPDVSLDIAGSATDDDYLTTIASFIDDRGLGNCVRMLGFCDIDSLVRAYAQSSVLCLFSLQEAAPVVVAQAMCAGRPVVASAAGGTPDLVVDGETGLLAPVADEEAFARAAVQVLSDAAMMQRMGENARALAEQRFRKEAVAAKTVEVYRKAIGQDADSGAQAMADSSLGDTR